MKSVIISVQRENSTTWNTRRWNSSRVGSVCQISPTVLCESTVCTAIVVFWCIVVNLIFLEEILNYCDEMRMYVVAYVISDTLEHCVM